MKSSQLWKDFALGISGFCAMSRCFPFPPPGYEKKGGTDFVHDKEKQRERKHRKEKRDKEKRETKEKREKEGRDGEHKEKKDKKEKPREKNKDKNKDKEMDKGRDRNKSKSGTADDKGCPGKAEGPNAGKLHQKEIKQNDKKGSLFEDKPTKQCTGNNGEKARQNNHLAEENKDSKFLMELDRRIKDDNGEAGNQLVQGTNTDNRKDEGNARFVAKGSGTWPDGKEKLKDKVFDAKKIVRKGIRAEAQPIVNATVENHAGNFHPRVDGTPRIMENNFNRTLAAKVEGKENIRDKKDQGKGKVKGKKDEAKEKIKENKDEGKEKIMEKRDDKQGDKMNNKEETKGHGKDKDRDKEKKKEKKAVEHTEVKTRELNKLKESKKAGPIGLNSFSQVSKNSHENAVSGENPKKRKDSESNGVPHALDNWPNKLPRPSSSSPFSENGRILEPCQISIPNASDRPGASAKLPHPDTKYMSQVYSVPKMEEWSGFDDREWLFESSISQERKPLVGSSEAVDTLQVWAEGMHIELADVYAMPYVTPY